MFIGGKSLPDVDLHAVLLQIHRADEGVLHRGDQVFRWPLTV